VLAIWTAAAWFILPVGKMVTGSRPARRSASTASRAVMTTLGLAGGAFIIFGVIPMPTAATAPACRERHQGLAHFGADGFIVQVHKRPGERIAAGSPSSPSNPRARAAQALHALPARRVRISERDAINRGEPATAILAQQRQRVARENIAELDRRTGELVVRAPHDGVVAGNDPALRLGGFVKRGEPVCDVVDPSDIRIAATLDQRQAAWLFDTTARPTRPSSARSASSPT